MERVPACWGEGRGGGVLEHFTRPYPSCQNTAPQVGRSAVKLQEETLWTTADPVVCPLLTYEWLVWPCLT